MSHPLGPKPNVTTSHAELPGAPGVYNGFRDSLGTASDPFLGFQQTLRKPPDGLTQSYHPDLQGFSVNTISGSAAYALPEAPHPLIGNRGGLMAPPAVDISPGLQSIPTPELPELPQSPDYPTTATPEIDNSPPATSSYEYYTPPSLSDITRASA